MAYRYRRQSYGQYRAQRQRREQYAARYAREKEQKARRAAIRAAKTPEQRAADDKAKAIGVAVVVLVIVVVVIIGAIVENKPHTSYGDGYAWGQLNMGGVISADGPACLQDEMTQSGPVEDPNLIGGTTGADEPNDNFARWRAGCEAGVLASLKTAKQNGQDTYPPNFNSGSTGSIGTTGSTGSTGSTGNTGSGGG